MPRERFGRGGVELVDRFRELRIPKFPRLR